MVDSSWFFSTLAQTIASVIGFILAFAAAIYTIQKNRIRQQLGRYLDSMDSTYRDFDEPLLSMVEDLREKGDFEAPFGGITLLFDDDPDIERWAEEEDSSVALLWAYLNEIHTQLNTASSSSNSGEIPQSFESLRENINEIKRLIEDNTITEEIYEEVVDEAPDEDYMTEQIFDFAAANEELLRKRSGKQAYTAHTIQGIDDVLTELDIDISSIERRHTPDRIAFYDQPPRDIFQNAIILFFVGVLIPMAFLFTPPLGIKQLTNYTTTIIFILQLLLLSAVALMSLRLFRSLWELIVGEEL